MKQIVTKRIYRFCLFLGVTAILLAGVLAPSLLTAQALPAPSFTLQAVVQGGLVYVTANNFPTSTTFTVTMGAAGTKGIGGSVVAHFDTASTVQSPTYIFEIPVVLGNAAAIDLRAARMWRDGLVAEMRGLLAAGYAADLRPFQSLGYRQALAVIAGKTGEAEALAEMQRTTRNYAKRQLTWFRADERIRWFDLAGERDYTDVAERICSYYRQTVSGR